MIYKEYGNCFRKLRDQKHLGMSQFKKVGVDRSCLSRFERGLSMMTFERIDMMLQEMQVSLSEYELLLNNFVPDFLEVFLTQLENADFDQNFRKLEELYQEAHSSGDYLLAIAVKARYSKPSEYELAQIYFYLQEIEKWGYFELSLIYFTMEHLTLDQLITLFYKFEEEGNNYYGIMKYRRRILQIAYRIVVILASQGEENIARHILKLTDEHKNVQIDLYIEVLHHLALGTVIYCFEDKEQGKIKLEHALITLEEFGYKKLKNFYSHRLSCFLNKK